MDWPSFTLLFMLFLLGELIGTAATLACVCNDLRKIINEAK
jgi:hypothetical protein